MSENVRQTIWLLKDEDEKSRKYEQAAEALNYQVAFTSVLQFQYFSSERLHEILSNLSTISGFVFTSPRAVHALSLHLDNPKNRQNRVKWTEKLKLLPIYVVGPSTADRLKQEYGFQPLGQDSGNAEALSRFIADAHECHGKPLVFLCGEKRRRVLRDDFGERREPFEEVVVYNPSAVDIAAKAVQIEWKKVQKVAIGPTTRDALSRVAEELNQDHWIAVAMASKPTPEDLIKAIDETKK